MKPITARTLDWVSDAPIRVTKTKVVNAPVEAVWTVISDHQSWSEWFGGVSKVEPLDSADRVGGHRRVYLPGMAVEEEFLAWEPETRFAFTLTHASRGLLKSGVEDVQLRANGDATTVTYTQAFEPAGPAFLSKVLAPVFGAGLKRGLDGLAKRVEG